MSGAHVSEAGLTCREVPMQSIGTSEPDETQSFIEPEGERLRSGVHCTRRTARRIRWCALSALVLGGVFGWGMYREYGDSSKLRVVTWNVAAINNNPFEYWITHEDAAYNKLMADVESFIDAPGARDVKVSEVFSEAMWGELKGLMASEGWSGLDETEKRWREDFSARSIITGFMQDKSLGSKRLASMPDRVTNTINTVDQGVVNRPTVINCFAGDMTSAAKWWAEWKAFMFTKRLTLPSGGGASTTPVKMLQPIKRAKYPAVTAEEEAISLPLQTLCQAIFDATLVHIVNSLSPDGKWQRLQQDMCDALNRKKDERILKILDTTYADAHIIFLQETATMFKTKAAADQLGSRYAIIGLEKPDGKRDQNSLVLLRRDYFDVASKEELTEKVFAKFDDSVPVAVGDLLVFSVDDVHGREYVLASFHGDTNGLATVPVVTAVSQLAATMPTHELLFGLDANTYAAGEAGKLQGVAEFGERYRALGLSSCWGDVPNPANHTTFNARTFLQAQLQKAARVEELKQLTSRVDKNPKDFILFRKPTFSVASTVKDNTGDGRYVEGMVFPTLAFPSDHGVLSTRLNVNCWGADCAA